MPRIPDKHKLLHGPYRPPRLYVGAVADCNLRGTVVITSWTKALISWPAGCPWLLSPGRACYSKASCSVAGPGCRPPPKPLERNQRGVLHGAMRLTGCKGLDTHRPETPDPSAP